MTAHVLLLDDERDTRELLARAVERAGYTCALASNAQEARASLAETPADVIVIDVMLGLDEWAGLRLLREVRQHGVRAQIVIITAFADVEKVKFALNEGAAYLLEKPFRAAQLIEVVERVRRSSATASRVAQIFESSGLTDKERIVAQHLLSGLSSTEIAELEANSPRTIRQHISQIYAKCGVNSRAEFLRLMFAQ